MRRSILTIAITFSLLSCGGMLTENEDKGVKEVLSFFGGYCSYSIGASASTDEGSKRYFELELSQSESLEAYQGNKDMITAKLAYLFFDKLSDEEKGNYTHIRGSLLTDDGEKYSKDYSIEELELVREKLPFVEKVVGLIRNKDFETLKGMISDQGTFRFDKNELVAEMERVDPEYGNINEFRLFGFRFSNAGYDPTLQIFGILMRDKVNHQFSVIIDPNSSKEEILKLDYAL